jgi:hypothetical protein
MAATTEITLSLIYDEEKEVWKEMGTSKVFRLEKESVNQ